MGPPATRSAWMRPVPNLLTVLRMGLAVAFPFVPAPWRLWVALAAGLSEFLDGYIARRFHVATRSGALMDGIADKLFVLSVVLTLVASGEVSWWQALLVMARDFVVAFSALYLIVSRQWAGFGRMQVRMAGKLTTALLFAWFFVLLLGWHGPLETTLFVLSAVASAVAAVDYGIQFLEVLRERRAARLS